MGFKYLPDVAIADIAFEATGKTLEEVFEQCGLAFADTTTNLNTLGDNEVQEITIDHAEPDRLLFDFLAELVYLKDAEGFLPKRFEIKIEENNTYLLTVKAYGEKINQEKHQLKNDIKAITMHMFKLEKTEEGYKALVVVDI